MVRGVWGHEPSGFSSNSPKFCAIEVKC